jgi:excinuclease ABC subunit A
MQSIRIQGARTHNLANIDVELPRDRLIVMTGLSGSGKSSLAFDTLYAEGQRRYVESLSTYARQFLSMMGKPDVDHIEGLSPAIAIDQKASSHNPRSTVGTATEIHDYLRLLFARAGTPHCPTHGTALNAQTISEMVDTIMGLPEGTKAMIIAPVVSEQTGTQNKTLQELQGQGFIRARIDGTVYELDDPPRLNPKVPHDVAVVVDRFKVRPDMTTRLADSLETALDLSDGIARLGFMDEPEREEIVFSSRYSCPSCGYGIDELEPRLFSFNNPHGACPGCDGIGERRFFDPAKVVGHPELSMADGAIRGWDRRNAYYSRILADLAAHYAFDPEQPWHELPESLRDVILHGSGDEIVAFHDVDKPNAAPTQRPFEGVLPNMDRRYAETESSIVREELARYLTTRTCPDCGGSRLNAAARNVSVGELTLPAITALAVGDAHQRLSELVLEGARARIAEPITREIQNRLSFLVNVGLDYLTLDRGAGSLSGGEAQRIRLASQIGAGLVGVMYVLDEPSIGLHQRDNARLLGTLDQLRAMGNTVIVVEHDEDAIRAADHVLDMGPGAGANGGHIVAEGSPEAIEATVGSLTGDYLAGRRRIAIPEQRITPTPDQELVIHGARGNNLQGVDLHVPAGLVIAITGVSGSGKSTLINDTLHREAARVLNGANSEGAAHDRVTGLEHFDKVVAIDQSPIGRTPRSNPATYTGLFNGIRELLAGTPEARSRGYGPGRFSFNVKGGRCEACQGDGVTRVEMHFLPDIFVPCDVCEGQRYNRETLEVRYKGYNIHEILELTVEQAREVFGAVPALLRKLDILADVGLSYVKLGQHATTLSGGEAQRIKLARELAKQDTGQTLYILDEPTTGLHFHDIDQLLAVLHRLRDAGNTVVIVEHNLDVIKTSDWVVDLGPDGGKGGGRIIAEGPPESIAREPASHTGHYLAPILGIEHAASDDSAAADSA